MRVLSQVVHTKDVNFCGVTLTVPSRVDYLAADKDGKVWDMKQFLQNLAIALIDGCQQIRKLTSTMK